MMTCFRLNATKFVYLTNTTAKLQHRLKYEYHNNSQDGTYNSKLVAYSNHLQRTKVQFKAINVIFNQ